MTRATSGGAPRPDEPAASHRRDLGGLSALAVLVIVLHHAGVPGFGGGFVGIDVVLVVAGFVGTGVLLGQVERHGRPLLGPLWAAGVRRVLPLSALVTVVTIAAAYVVGGTALGDRTAATGGWSAVLLANAHLGPSDLSPTEAVTAATSPLQHLWALSVLEQAAVVWPLLLLAVALVVRRDADIRRTLLILVLLGVGLVSLTYSLLHSASAPGPAYVASSTRAWELVAGALLALTTRGARPLRGLVGVEMGALGLVMIGGAVVLLDAATPYPSATALLPVVGAVLVLGAGIAAPTNPVSGLLGGRGLVQLGRRAFGLYLWHLPLLVLPAVAWGPRSTTRSVLLLLVALAAADATYRLLERPLSRSPRLRERPARAGLALGGALVAALVATAVLAPRIATTTVSSGASASDADSGAGRAADGATAAVASVAQGPSTVEVRAAIAAAVDRDEAPADLDPPIEAVAEQGGLSDAERACERDPGDRSADLCLLGETSSDSTVVLWGDEHAAMWSPAMDVLGRQSGVRVAVIAKQGCAPLLGVTPWHPENDRQYTECATFNDSAAALVGRLDPAAVILTGTFRGWAWTEDGKTRLDAGTDPESIQAVWDTGLTSSITRLRDSSPETTVLVLGGTATPLRDNARCLASDPASISRCAVPVTDAVLAEHDSAERAAALAAGAAWVPTTQWQCAEGVCPAAVGPRVVWLDDTRLTRQYVLWLARAFGRAIGIIETEDTGNDPLVPVD